MFRLGDQIVAEFEEPERSDTLLRWLAFRVAELMQRAESIDLSISEQAKRECSELILKIWQLRRKWPNKDPFDDSIAILKKLESPPRWSSQQPADRFERTLKDLEAVSVDEYRACVDAILARYDLESEVNYLEEHRALLNEKEIGWLEFLVGRLKHLRSDQTAMKLVGRTERQKARALATYLAKLIDRRREVLKSLDEFPPRKRAKPKAP